MHLNPEQRTPTLRVRPMDIAHHALVVGDPNRAADAAQLLDKAEEVGNFREYRTFTGIYAGKRVTISSHGVGSSGANLCFYELFQCGVRNIIRAGTCGAMVAGIQDGDQIIATGAIREDGCSEHLAPMSFPAVSDRLVTRALESASVEMGIENPHVGLVLSQAYFYPGILPNETDAWLKTGLVVAVEMEVAPLLVMASLQGVRAGAILTSDGNLTQDSDPDHYDPHRNIVEEGKLKMLKIALKALVRLAD
jgi:uridine phosphorylase